MRLTHRMSAIGVVLSCTLANAQIPIGQGSASGDTLASRCFGANARFNFSTSGAFDMHGPSGIAIEPSGRLYVTDFGGRRVLTWPNVDLMRYCPAADAIIGAGELAGPESVAIDTVSGAVFVADTLDHTVKGYVHSSGQRTGFEGGRWTRFVTLGTPGNAGNGSSQFNFPRGLAVDATGRLFVADDFNNRVLIFSPPFADGQAASDSIGAFADGGFSSPKGLAIHGNTLFVADYNNGRVLRFTGPFNTPERVYTATGIFRGVSRPVDVGVHPDGALLITDQGNQRVVQFEDAIWSTSTEFPNKTYTDGVHAEPLGVAADRYGRVYIADYRAYRILVRNAPIHKFSITTRFPTIQANMLLTELHDRASWGKNQVAIGQQLLSWQYGSRSDPNAWYGSWLKMEQTGMRLPHIMGAELSDLMSYEGFSPNADALAELIRHGQRNRIVTLVWHPDNPTGGDFGTPVSTADLWNMINYETPIGQRWREQLQRAAAVLQEFQRAGVPVLFRPIHEQNGTFFWWGHDGSSGAELRERQAAWVALWRTLVAEMAVTEGLQNLLFVFGANQVNYDGVAPPLTYYPGQYWTDAVSIDVYNDQLNLAGADRGYQHYAALIGTGKPFGLAEFGQSFDENGTGPDGAAWDARMLLQRIGDSYPRTVFAVAWYSSVERGVPNLFALPDVSFGRELLEHPLLQTQGN